MEKIQVVKLLIQNKDGNFLMLKKAPHYDWMADKWELPGGKIEEGETREEAIRRETKSETGLKIGNISDVVRVKVEETGEKPIVDCWILYSGSFYGEVELSEEHQGWKWVADKEFREMDWHRDAGYAIPAMEYLEEYLG